ncbi:MAG: sigma-70 family RNA polymerase sigma factor [Bacteroidales bacterium]|nr:sigma-70 family RNA polymerase sigma factor [Bacteroidales bacterium]
MFDTILKLGRDGDEQALMRLYDLCCNAVYNASYNIVLNEQDAEEIAHDAILAAFSLLRDFNGNEACFVAWVKKIAVNKSIDKYRHDSRRPMQVDVDEFKEKTDDDDDDMYSIEQVKAALSGLPEGYRIVITLRLLEEMEYEDIANTLNINESSVRSQYSRGIARLRKVLRVN